MQSKLFGAVEVILSIYILVIICPSHCRLHMLYPIYPMKVVLVIALIGYHWKPPISKLDNSMNQNPVECIETTHQIAAKKRPSTYHLILEVQWGCLAPHHPWPSLAP